MSNILNSNSTPSSVSNSNNPPPPQQQQQQYSNFHTLQPANQQNHPNHHQNLNQYLSNSATVNHQSSNYLTLNTIQNSGQTSHQPPQQQQQQQTAYMPKLVQRASSFNSSPIASNSSSASSPSSSLSSSSGSTLITSNHQFGPQLSLPCNLGSGSGNDFDPRVSSPTSSGLTSPSVPTDPAEIARLKQARNIKLTPEEVQLLVKDRQRKDNHNMSKKYYLIARIL